MGALHGVGLARPQLAVDLGQGLVAVLAQVLLEGIDDQQAGLVLGREEDLERLALADEQVEGRVADLFGALDLALDPGQGRRRPEVFLDQRDARDAGLLEGGQDVRGDSLLGRGPGPSGPWRP